MSNLSEVLAELAAGLTFYRQQRVDGGIRTGIMLGMETVFEKFEGDEDQYDPSLAWSVDLRCNGPSLPDNPTGARAWLIAHHEEIRDGFRLFADQLGVGSDPTGVLLLEWSDFPNPPPGVSMKIVCGALRRVDARYLSNRLAEVGEGWLGLVNELEPTFHEAY
jgi:hypothetical protein